MTTRSAEELIATLREGFDGRFVEIDGLPLAGKTTLSRRLASELGWSSLSLDEFFLPREQWPTDIEPALPFPFFRWGELRHAVDELRTSGAARYRAYDGSTSRLVTSVCHARRGPVCVEGCSILSAALVELFELTVFVCSDATTLRAARRTREGDAAESDWEQLFLPSVALYLQTNPAARADVLVRGRGA